MVNNANALQHTQKNDDDGNFEQKLKRTNEESAKAKREEQKKRLDEEDTKKLEDSVKQKVIKMKQEIVKQRDVAEAEQDKKNLAEQQAKANESKAKAKFEEANKTQVAAAKKKALESHQKSVNEVNAKKNQEVRSKRALEGQTKKSIEQAQKRVARTRARKAAELRNKAAAEKKRKRALERRQKQNNRKVRCTDFRVWSAGWPRNFWQFWAYNARMGKRVQNKNTMGFRRGFNVAAYRIVGSPRHYTLIGGYPRSYDTHASHHHANRLARDLDRLPCNTVIMLSCMDECMNRQTTYLHQALHRAGLGLASRWRGMQFRNSYVGISRKCTSQRTESAHYRAWNRGGNHPRYTRRVICL